MKDLKRFERQFRERNYVTQLVSGCKDDVRSGHTMESDGSINISYPEMIGSYDPKPLDVEYSGLSPKQLTDELENAIDLRDKEKISKIIALKPEEPIDGLYSACCTEDPEIVEMYLIAYPKQTQEDMSFEFGNSCKNGNEEITKIIIKHGCDPDYKEGKNGTWLSHYCGIYNQTNKTFMTIERMLKYGADPTAHDNLAIKTALEHKNYKALEIMARHLVRKQEENE